MVSIPGATFVLRVQHRVREGRCPMYDHGPRPVTLKAFALGCYPITNGQYAAFLAATDYRPGDARNFLRHWSGGRPPDGQEKHPVVWVSPRDAEAYARWAGLRLPTDEEWQWAAQGGRRQAWPWGGRFEPGRCNDAGRGTTPIDAYPGGTSPFGCCDMVGNVWEWTGPEFDDGWHRWRLIRGGSYFTAQGSTWYTDGGARRADFHLRFFLMGEGLNRSAAVGFRCAADLPGAEE